ncbi:MAG: hypothetical protein AAF487_00780 [Bacteroidota bacterium]
MRIFIGFAAFFMLIMTFSSCETDFELNAPYEKTAVIFGFLEMSADTQFFRIQKTFLGEGDAVLFAQEPDSSYFDNVQGKVFWTNENGATLGMATMDEIIITDKDTDGAFFAPEQLVYYIPSSDIDFDVDYTYHLEVIADGQTYTSSTRLVEIREQFVQQPSPTAQDPEISMVSGQGPTVNYLDKRVRFTTQEFARRYNISMNYLWNDVRTDGTFGRNFNLEIGNVITEDDLGGATEERSFNSEAWYALIDNLTDPHPNLQYREAGRLDFKITLAAEDLHNYLSVNEPVTSIVTERPEYTNINKGDNGEPGIGIFSSRFTITRTKFLNFSSMREMVCGQYTLDDLFCDPNSGSLQCGTGFDCN